jgi:hypothetical protein
MGAIEGAAYDNGKADWRIPKTDRRQRGNSA